jgi:hypothetical protein
MKTKKNILFLIENGLSSKTVSSLSDKQFGLLVEKFKNMKKQEEKEGFQKTTIPSQTVLKGNLTDLATTGVDVKDGNVKYDQATGQVTVMTKEGEVSEDAAMDYATGYNPNEEGGNLPKGNKNPEDYGTDNSTDPDGQLDGMPTEGEIKEKFESKAQQGLFWARCNKCSSKNCKWCKMAKEFSDSTSEKQYKKMPEKKHPEKTVKYKKKETKENLQKFLEEKISQIVDENIDAKMSKKDLIETLKKKSKSMIIRRPKKMTMFSDEAPMELPIGKLYSIGKTSK